MKKRLLRFLLLPLLLALAAIALDQRLIVRHYAVETGQLNGTVRIAVLSDYHGCDYGPDGQRLVAAVHGLSPDLIVMLGDMFPVTPDTAAVLAMFRVLAGIADTYYVTGNHEYGEQDVPALLEDIRQCGVTVLHDANLPLDVNGVQFILCGVPDPQSGGRTHLHAASAAAGVAPEDYAILLAHRPESIAKYEATGAFDLVLSGHAHGGQVRIPGLVNGLYAPNQGWFPAYAGGCYQVGSTTMIVSRGLSTQGKLGIPRLFNRPELLLVELH